MCVSLNSVSINVYIVCLYRGVTNQIEMLIPTYISTVYNNLIKIAYHSSLRMLIQITSIFQSKNHSF